ncbi:MAG: glycosyltransferase family 39 protein, partial [Proteobacteria bacterium]|nr:glycosyltransferase family 39 protein [Pseudomonadota bacterium]
MRLLSLLLGGLTVYLTFMITLNFLPGEPMIAAIGALLVATNPQFLHLSASVSNESLSTALATLYLLILINYLESPSKLFYQIVSGIVLGCCLLTKISTILYIPVTAIALIWGNWRNWKNLTRNFVIIFLVAALVSLWWYLKNLIVYNDLIFTKALNAIQPWSMRKEPLSLASGALITKMTFISFWGYFGAQQIPVTAIHLSFYGSLMVLGCA